MVLTQLELVTQDSTALSMLQVSQVRESLQLESQQIPDHLQATLKQELHHYHTLRERITKILTLFKILKSYNHINKVNKMVFTISHLLMLIIDQL